MRVVPCGRNWVLLSLQSKTSDDVTHTHQALEIVAETTVTYHLTPSRVAPRTQDQKPAAGEKVKELGACALLVGM